MSAYWMLRGTFCRGTSVSCRLPLVYTVHEWQVGIFTFVDLVSKAGFGLYFLLNYGEQSIPALPRPRSLLVYFNSAR